MFCARCPYCSVLHYLSLSYTHSHTDCFRLTGENIHRQCEKWSGTDGIRMIETTYNGSHNFPIFLPDCPSFADCFSPPPPPPLFPRSCPTTPIAWMHRPSLFNAIQAHRSCQSGSGSLEAPWRYTKSAKRRKRGGRSTRRRRHREERRRRRFLVFFFSPPPTNGKPCSHFSCGIFSPSHIFLKIPEDLHQITF